MAIFYSMYSLLVRVLVFCLCLLLVLVLFVGCVCLISVATWVGKRTRSGRGSAKGRVDVNIYSAYRTGVSREIGHQNTVLCQ